MTDQLKAIENAEKIINVLRIRVDPDMAFVRRDATVAAFDRYNVGDLARYAIHYLASLLDGVPE